MMVEMFILRLAPLFAGERAEEWMDIAVEAFRARGVKFIYQLP
jgi:hypothetical protein